MYDNVRLLCWLRDRYDLTATEKLIAMLIASHRNPATGLCCPGQGRIARQAGLSRYWVNKLVADLKRMGVVEVHKGRFRDFSPKTVHNYVFLFDESAVETS